MKIIPRVIKKSFFSTLSSFTKLRELGATFFFIINCLILFFVVRLSLLSSYYEISRSETEFWKIFLLGPQIDITVLLYMTVLPLSLQLISPNFVNHFLKKAYTVYYTLISILVLFLEISTFRYMEEFGHRPHRTFAEYLNRLQEVTSVLLKEEKIILIITAIVIYLTTYIISKSYRYILKNHSPLSWKLKIIFFPLFPILTFIAFSKTTINTASFSNQHIVNEITLNSSYSLGYAMYRMFYKGNPHEIYSNISKDKIIPFVKKSSMIPGHHFLNYGKNYIYHRQVSPLKHKKIPNVVIILMESIGAAQTGFLGKTPLTPNLDKLSKKGISFTNLYSTGTRTARGIEAILTGIFPKPGRSIIKLPKSKNSFFTIAKLLKKHGHKTSFIYGGDSNFDEMKTFFLKNGFDDVYDEMFWSKKYPRDSWGVHDEYVFKEAHKIFNKIKDRPFFSLILTVSTHPPFDIPRNKIELFEKPKNTYFNAIKYADYAIGSFFKLSKTSEYYNNTIFLLMADHNFKVYGPGLVPIDKFHIPAILFGPGIPQIKYEKLAGAFDIPPTLLHFLGTETVHPMLGRNLMTLPDQTPGRAIMQYAQTLIYRVDNQVVVMKPIAKPQNYLFINGKLSPSPLNQVLIEEAKAFSFFSWLMYDQQLYK